MILDCILQDNPLPPAFNSGLLVATKQNLRWPPGAYGDLKARLRRQDGTPVVLTGGILRLAIREVTNVTSAAALVRDATLTNEAQGLAVFQLDSGDTAAFVEGRRYFYDVWWLDASGRRYQVVPHSEWVAAPVVLETGDQPTLGPSLPPGPFEPPVEPELDPLAAIAAAGATGSLLRCIVEDHSVPPPFGSGLMVPTRQPLRWPRGAYGELAAQVQRRNGSPVVLSDGILRLAIRSVTNVAIPPLLIRDAIITNAEQGLAYFVIVTSDTAGLAQGQKYYYDVWWLDPNGERYQVVPISEWLAAPTVLQPADAADIPGATVPLPVWVQSVVAGSGVSVNNMDPRNPVVSATSSAILAGVVAGAGITVDGTDPALPVIAATTTGVVASLNAGPGVAIDASDPVNPTISATGTGVVASLSAGAGIAINSADPVHPVISATATGVVANLVAGAGVSVDATDPVHPVVTAEVTAARLITAGAGLAGGGSLSADRTIDVVANPDGSIVVSSDDVRVGVLATDAQHGARGGGSLHADAVAGGNAGFLSGADKSKLDGLPSAAVAASRQVVAGGGLVGGGDLTADRTFSIAANADGSIVVNADDIGVGVLASDAQHGDRGGGGLHATAVAGGNAGFLSGADKSKLDGLPSSAVVSLGAGAGISVDAFDPLHPSVALAWANVGNGELLRKIGDALAGYPILADWALTGIRYYACDYINGSDSNVGYSDVSATAAGAVAVKTIEKMLSLVPRFGAGRAWVGLVRGNPSGASLTYYRPGSGTVVDDVDLRPFRDYRYYNVRTTRDFAGTVADKELLAPEIVLQGPNSDGSFTVAAGGTTSGISIAAGTLTALPGIAGYRVRFKGVVTAGLANISRNIAYNTTTALQFGETTAIAPAEGEQFFIERPGVIIDNFFSGSGMGGGGGSGFTSTFQAHVAGFRCLQTTLATAFVSGSDLTVDLSFMEFHNRFSCGYVQSVRVAHDYYDELGLSRVSGMGMRVTCNASPNMLIGASSAQFNITHSAILKGTTTTNVAIIRCMGSAVIGGGCYMNIAVAPLAGTGIITIGNNGITQIRRAYFDGGANVRVSSGVMWCNVRGCDFNNLGSAAAVLINTVQYGMLLFIDDCLSSHGGNTGVVVSMSANGFYSRVMFGLAVANNLAWTGADFLTVDGTITQANLNASQMIDSRQNIFLGASTGARLRRLTPGVDFNTPVLTADPASPMDGDEWTTNIGGVRSKCKRIGGVTYRTVLT